MWAARLGPRSHGAFEMLISPEPHTWLKFWHFEPQKKTPKILFLAKLVACGNIQNSDYTKSFKAVKTSKQSTVFWRGQTDHFGSSGGDPICSSPWIRRWLHRCELLEIAVPKFCHTVAVYSRYRHELFQGDISQGAVELRARSKLALSLESTYAVTPETQHSYFKGWVTLSLYNQ